MNDKLGREICVGDTLAYCKPDYSVRTYPFPTMRLAKVLAVATFGIQVTAVTDDAKAPPETWVVSDTSSEYAICATAE